MKTDAAAVATQGHSLEGGEKQTLGQSESSTTGRESGGDGVHRRDSDLILSRPIGPVTILDEDKVLFVRNIRRHRLRPNTHSAIITTLLPEIARWFL